MAEFYTNNKFIKKFVDYKWIEYPDKKGDLVWLKLEISNYDKTLKIGNKIGFRCVNKDGSETEFVGIIKEHQDKYINVLVNGDLDLKYATYDEWKEYIMSVNIYQLYVHVLDRIKYFREIKITDKVSESEIKFHNEMIEKLEIFSNKLSDKINKGVKNIYKDSHDEKIELIELMKGIYEKMKNASIITTEENSEKLESISYKLKDYLNTNKDIFN